MIRDSVIGDTEALFELTKLLYGDFMKEHNMPMVDADLKKTVIAYIKLNQFIVVERDGKIVGLAAWQLSPHPANYSSKVFQEVLWCVNSPNVMDASILLKAFERKARQMKASVMVMANLSKELESKLRRIYEKRGFSFLETHYIKSMGG